MLISTHAAINVDSKFTSYPFRVLLIGQIAAKFEIWLTSKTCSDLNLLQNFNKLIVLHRET